MDQVFAQYNYERSMSCLKKHKSQQTHTEKSIDVSTK